MTPLLNEYISLYSNKGSFVEFLYMGVTKYMVRQKQSGPRIFMARCVNAHTNSREVQQTKTERGKTTLLIERRSRFPRSR